MAFDWKGTFNKSQFDRFASFARSQVKDIPARIAYLVSEQIRVGTLVFSYDANGRPIAYTPDPVDSYLGKLLAVYEILGGDTLLDLNVRSLKQPVYPIKADETLPSQLLSNGEIMSQPGLADRATAYYMDQARDWMQNVVEARKEYLERKIRRLLDYSEQLQQEQLLLALMVEKTSVEGSLENTLSEIQQLIDDPTYRAAYDDRGADPQGKLTHAPHLPYSTGPNRAPTEVYGKDTGSTGVVKPGTGGT
jgi:hypothetical protein